MDYIINEYHRNTSDEELLADLKRVAIIYNKKSLTTREYANYGKYHWSTIGRRFGGWNSALKKANLSIYRGRNSKHVYCEADEFFFEDVRNVARIVGRNYITVGDYKRFGKYSISSKIRKYENWNEILRLSELSSTPYRLGKGKKITDKELFEDIERVWIKLGRQPTITDIRKGEFHFSQNTFCRRFGGWRNTLKSFIAYINAGDFSEEIDSTEKLDIPQFNNSKQIITHKTPRNINLRLRFKVMARDHFRCCKCGKSPAKDSSVELHVDHKYPWSKGGETIMDNLETLCSDCNLGKSDFVID